MTIFLDLERIIAIHDSQIELYGGSHGIRDLSLLESAVFRPQTSFAGKSLYPNIYLKAAVLMHSLILNHAFVNGNKRTGVVSALVFFELNNIRIISTSSQLINLALGIEAKKANLKQISIWFKKHSQPVK